MPAAQPVGFRRRAVALACAKEKPIVQLASDLGISESSLRRCMKTADVDERVQEGETSDAPAEPGQLWRENRVQAEEIEILSSRTAQTRGHRHHGTSDEDRENFLHSRSGRVLPSRGRVDDS